VVVFGSEGVDLRRFGGFEAEVGRQGVGGVRLKLALLDDGGGLLLACALAIGLVYIYFSFILNIFIV
jgi:hypothetical protein